MGYFSPLGHHVRPSTANHGFRPQNEFSFGKEQDRIKQQAKYEEGSKQKGGKQMLGKIQSWITKNKEIALIGGLIVAYFVIVK